MTTFTAMPKYEAYKDSGVEWIGEIPIDWKTIQIRYVAKRFSNGTTAEQLAHDESSFMVSRIETISDGNINYSKVGFLKKVTNLTAYSLEQNDFLISHINSYEKIGNSAMYKGEQPLWHGMNLIRISPHSVHHKLFNFILKSELFIGAMKRACKPAINQVSVPTSSIKSIKIVIPPSHEQTAIANFLDEKTAQIDEAIAIKEKQIELLKERKQIIIQQAVTQGLDPTVPMKDSGVEWIGKIPAHWEVKKLKYLLTEPLKYGANESGIEYQKDLPRYIRITDFSGEGKLNEDKKLSLSWDKGRNYLLKDGDILLARSGATVGKSYQFKSAMSNEAFCCFAGYLIKVSADEDKILSNYLDIYLNSDCFLAWKSSIFNKATIENIGADKYAIFPVIVPNIKEQLDILDTIQTNFEPIDTVLNFQLKQIERLKEYKTTLINSAVTGKIKVM